jgi:hypothetical protein
MTKLSIALTLFMFQRMPGPLSLSPQLFAEALHRPRVDRDLLLLIVSVVHLHRVLVEIPA